MVKHPVHDYAGHRNIHPDGKGNPCNFTMGLEAFFGGEVNRTDGQKWGRRSQCRVSSQNREIGGLEDTRSGITMNSGQIKSGEIRNKEDNGEGKGGDHAVSMKNPSMVFYRQKPDEKKYSGKSV